MAEPATLGFRPGRSIPHRVDARFKLVSLAMVNIVTLRADFPSLAVLTAILTAAIGHTGIPFRAMAREMRYFGFLLLLIFAARALSTPGAALISAAGMAVTREGLAAGGLVCWRLACIVLAGILFIAATRPSEVRGAVIWLLAPIPWIPERRAGTMLSLLVRFVPMILDQARETMDAQRARCIECRKNPVIRLAVLAVALLRRIFEDADRLIVAMEARCYNEERTGPAYRATRLDWAALFGTTAVCCGIVLRSW
jgi:energy-coupling factor transporter transmembrane protein EcfT